MFPIKQRHETDFFMDSKQLTQLIANKMQLSEKKTAKMLEIFTDIIVEETCNGNNVMLPNFGTFELKERGARKFYRPQTKDYQIIPAKKVLGFKPSSKFKDIVKGTES